MTVESHKLDGETRQKLYNDIFEGVLNDSEIARKYKINHATVFYYRKKEQGNRMAKTEHFNIKKPFKTIGEIETAAPKPVEKIPEYKEPAYKKYEDYEPRHTSKTYMEIQREEEEKRLNKILECDHYQWVKRCSRCGAILESDAQINDHYTHKTL